MIVGIDASRNRSGGAKAHLIGILKESDPMKFGISEVHVWTYKSLANLLPDYPWLVKHSPSILERSIFSQLYWQYFILPKEVRQAGCKILLYTDAGALVNFNPCLVMSRDMLSYEPGEMKRYGFSKSRLRLLLLKYVQAYSLRKAESAIFLTNYAANIIERFTGKLNNKKIIPHGTGAEFRQSVVLKNWEETKEAPIRALYISNTALYKHQWNVVKALSILRKKGIDMSLDLVGGGSGKAQIMLNEVLNEVDPEGNFIKQYKFVSHNEIPEFIRKADLFLFASSCENMPNTLLEGMCAGLPIASSNRGPMPEVLEDGGVYFDPEDPQSIADSIMIYYGNHPKRVSIAKRALELSTKYSWNRSGSETWEQLILVANQFNNIKNK